MTFLKHSSNQSGRTRPSRWPWCKGAMNKALPIVLIVVTLVRGAELPPYPQYEFSHVLFDIMNTPFRDEEGRGRLPDEWPVANGREWIGEGVYADPIKVEGLVPNPLGKYYLYFSIHAHVGVGLAYADNLNGPWHVLDTLLWKQGAAADVIWLEDEQRFAAYYHPSNTYSVIRLSRDGINWTEPQTIAHAGDLIEKAQTFFYTKVWEHTCPSLGNRYIMMWRVEMWDGFFIDRAINWKWHTCKVLMYSDNGIDWSIHPEPILCDGNAMGTNFMKWGDSYLLMNWGSKLFDYSYNVGGPYCLIWKTDPDLASMTAVQTSERRADNSMTLIEAEPGCGYTIDADSGRGPYEGQHLIEGDTLYHFSSAWTDSGPTGKCYNGKAWGCGLVGLWKAPVPEGAVSAESVPTTRNPAGRTRETSRSVSHRAVVVQPGRGIGGKARLSSEIRRVTVYSPHGRRLGDYIISNGNLISRNAGKETNYRGVRILHTTQ